MLAMKPALLLQGSLHHDAYKSLCDHFNVFDIKQLPDWEGFRKRHENDVVALLTNGHDGAPRSLVEQFPNLKVIACNGVGYDAVDIPCALERQIMVTHTPNVLNKDVANTTLLLMLAISRRLMRDTHWIEAGRWANEGNAPLTQSIEGARVGIVGLGRIGSTIARKLQAFDCELSYHARSQKSEVHYAYYANLVEMAKAVSYLVVITPGDDSTHHLINRDVMEALGPQGTLINVARGSVVDEPALVDALTSGKLGAAALDVFENEPYVPEALLGMDNVLLTPHVGSATEQTRRAMGNLAANNIISFYNEGEAISPVPECHPKT